MQVQAVEQLTELELAAWRGLLRVPAAVVRELDDELQEAHGLQLSAYEVLLVLDQAPERRLRMAELAGSTLLSHSGVTRLVDRLERDGLVRRERCDDDRRGLFARLTSAGGRRLAEARPTHLDGARRRFLAHYSEDELRTLARLWEHVLPGASP